MIMLGIDAHKRSHTVVAVDDLGRQLGTKTTKGTTTAEHLGLIRWADRFGAQPTWAVEDCRHLSRLFPTYGSRTEAVASLTCRNSGSCASRPCSRPINDRVP